MRYAMVKDGIAQTVFETDLDKSAFLDIADLLVECGPEVQCNWTYDGQNFATNLVPRPDEPDSQ